MKSNEENKIKWDKLEELLDKPSIDADQAGLNQEERSVLLFFKRLRARLKPVNKDTEFPLEAGWEALRSRIENASIPAGSAKGKLSSMSGFRIAVAALLIVAAGAAIWWLSLPGTPQEETGKLSQQKKQDLATQPVYDEVKLQLADGSVVTLSELKSITEKNGVAINADGEKIVYDTAGNTTGQLIYNTLIVPRGRKSELKLPDGSRVWVNADSRIKYPVAFSGINREVILEGEAYFDVVPMAGKPFVVRNGNMEVQVLGTAFNVNTYGSVFVTTLESGKVKVSANDNAVTLSPGEQASLYTSTGQIRKVTVHTRLFTAWKDGILFLDDMALNDIAEVLEREFDCDIEFAEPSLRAEHFTIDMVAPPGLQQVLIQLNKLAPEIKFSINGRKVIISK